MTPTEAEDLATRILAEIDHRCGNFDPDNYAADRERVASDLAGLREHGAYLGKPERGCRHDSFGRMQYAGPRPWSECTDARRYATGLLRTAALYGVTP